MLDADLVARARRKGRTRSDDRAARRQTRRRSASRSPSRRRTIRRRSSTRISSNNASTCCRTKSPRRRRRCRPSHALVRERDASLEAKDARLQGVDEKVARTGQHDRVDAEAAEGSRLQDRFHDRRLAGADAKANAAREEVAKQIAANQALQRNLAQVGTTRRVLSTRSRNRATPRRPTQAQAQERDVAVDERDARRARLDTKCANRPNDRVAAGTCWLRATTKWKH